MLALAFIRWWYGEGWRQAGRTIINFIHSISEGFSVSLLLKTLAQPWRRIVSHPGAGLSAHIHASMDNAVSRLVGLAVRLLVIMLALIVICLGSVAGLIAIICWPLIPLATIASLIYGFI